MELTDEAFQSLMKMKKKFKTDISSIPAASQRVQFSIIGEDNKTEFTVDVDRKSRIEMKSKVQERYCNNILLVRVEINGPPHTNPDGSNIGRDHIHTYREGYGLSWAYNLAGFDPRLFKDKENFTSVFSDFCLYCNIELDGEYQIVM
jgi:hypothetical protein